ncbi:MAG: alpha/beta hydrolase [Ruminococcaceae bacterium]|nr:alpha/beta hydrolase [Oscillospiraceae bacterium]
MKTETFEFNGYKETALPARLWMPEGEVKAVLQVTHGMTEHIGRYDAFAEHLQAEGIAVAGFDLRGHGKNPGDAGVASFGKSGWEASVEDMRLFYTELHGRFPGVPHYMLGFSLGSFLLREYLSKYPGRGELAGAVIMGTGHQPGWLLAVMMAIVKGQIKKAGFDRTTDLVRRLSFGTYNQKFKPNRTSADWLCSDEAELDKYLADPLVRRDISAGLFWELLGSMKRTGSTSVYGTWHSALPVLLISGEDDPVGNGGKGVRTIYGRMKKAGLRNVTVKLFPGARHDLLHEGSAARAARELIAEWIVSRF